MFGSRVIPGQEVVKMNLWIRNGSPEKLTGLRAQVCVMLKGLSGFNQRIHANKVIDGSWVACRDADGQRWIITGWEPLHRPWENPPVPCLHADPSFPIITGWEPLHRPWENPPVPCLHADPSFPDCLPGKTVQAKGIIAFHEGKGIRQQIAKLKALYLNRQ